MTHTGEKPHQIFFTSIGSYEATPNDSLWGKVPSMCPVQLYLKLKILPSTTPNDSLWGKSPTNVHSVTFQAPQLANWQFTWEVHTLEKSHTSVANVRTVLFQRVICTAIQCPTLRRRLSFAIVAAKHFNANRALLYMDKVTLLQHEFCLTKYWLSLKWITNRKCWFHNGFENECMQPVWLSILWSKCFEDTSENAEWKNATNVTFNPLGQAIWGFIWKHTVEKSQTNATDVIMHAQTQVLWGHIWKHTLEKSSTSATSVIMPHLRIIIGSWFIEHI